MLYPLFQLGNDRYALSIAQIVEVLPLAATRSIPDTPAWVVGMIERHDVPVPVTDVPQFALGHPARPLRSTRLVLMHYEADIHGDDAPLLGLVLEHATHTRRIDDTGFTVGGVVIPDARWLGPMANLDDGLVQHVDTEAMPDAHVRTLLFPAAVD